MRRDTTKPGRPQGSERLGPADALRGGGPGRQKGFVERATAGGYSGQGAESVRPHLRDQLRLKALLPHPFPASEDEGRGKDSHHR